MTTPPVRLQIGEAQTMVAVGPDGPTQARLVLAIGSRKTAADFFRHVPPTPAELETAIMVVEDEVTRARALLAGHSRLVTADTLIGDIARIAGVPASRPAVLPVESVERVFDLLAAFSQGRPAASAGIPADPALLATLLIVREFMHHLQFVSILVED